MFGAVTSAARMTREVGHSTLKAIAISLLSGIVALGVLHRLDVGSVFVSILVALIVLVLVFFGALMVVSSRLERERDQARRDFDVLQQRISVENRIRSIVEGIESDFAARDSDAAITPARVGWHANMALETVRTDRYPSIGRVRELEEFLVPMKPGDARRRYEELHRLLRDNVYNGVYLRS
jgi:hypothetical protein